MGDVAAQVPGLYWALIAFGIVLGGAGAVIALLIGFRFKIFRWGWDGGPAEEVKPNGLTELIKRLERIEEKIDSQQGNHAHCREGLLEKIAEKVDWDAFYSHTHDPKDWKVKR
ncbi:MAG: hypothetical protein M1438_09570 [Deltaproteobacteria bacterium]|nr:hypothetical protein [Deltaproteobacteria bacterium]